MSVRRIFVEKRRGFDVPAKQMFDDLRETLEIEGLDSLRLFQRYDIEGLDDSEFAAVKNIVFSEPPVDVIYEEELPIIEESSMFTIIMFCLSGNSWRFDIDIDIGAIVVNL